MHVPSLTNPDEFIEVPRWLPDGYDCGHLIGKRVFVEIGGCKHRSLEICIFSVHRRISDGRFAVDLAMPRIRSAKLPCGYVYHLSREQLELVRPIEHPRYEFRYAGVLFADHNFASSFPELIDSWSA